MEPTVLAYIAGFLDGDGSIFFQIIRKNDYRLRFQIRSSIAFYQKTDNEHLLTWLKERLASGCLRRRGTGISDYTIVDSCEVRRILLELQPYVRLKREQVRLGLEILTQLPFVGDPLRFIALCRRVDEFRHLNYSKKRTVTAEVVEQHFQERGLLQPPGHSVAEPDQYAKESNMEFALSRVNEAAGIRRGDRASLATAHRRP